MAVVQGPADFFQLGDWNVICSICGRKAKASTMERNWQGMWRHPWHNEPRQPQDFVRGIPEHMTPPWVQAMPANVFQHQCTPQGVSAVPGEAQPGCVFPNYMSTAYINAYFTP